MSVKSTSRMSNDRGLPACASTDRRISRPSTPTVERGRRVGYPLSMTELSDQDGSLHEAAGNLNAVWHSQRS